MSTGDRLLVPIILLGTIFLLFSPAHAVVDVETGNSCVRCHSKLSSSNFMGVKSHSWAGSVHQQHGVTCDKCHGGNPDAAIAIEAHKGVLSSRNPKSTVYFQNIPSTCGQCHGSEFYKFSQSRHYEMLQSTGRGPECVTCHGSMVTSILAPETIAAVCARCHNNRMGIRPFIPEKARAVLLLLRESQALLDVTEKLYQPADGSKAANQMRAARASLHSAKLEWHRFDLDVITDYLQEMYESLGMLRNHPDVGKTESAAGKGQKAEK